MGWFAGANWLAKTAPIVILRKGMTCRHALTVPSNAWVDDPQRGGSKRVD
jgi:hypothetical protein